MGVATCKRMWHREHAVEHSPRYGLELDESQPDWIGQFQQRSDEPKSKFTINLPCPLLNF